MSKTILITGGAGFIAHHFIDRILSETDWRVVTLDRLDYSGNLNRLNEVVASYDPATQKRVKVVHHDLKAEINPLINTTIGKVNYVAHLAAGSHVDRSIEYPLEFVMDNVVGTTNLLDWSRQHDSIERFIYFSTDEVFGSLGKYGSFNESTQYDPRSPYSASKAASDHLVNAWHHTFDIPVITVGTDLALVVPSPNCP